MSSKHLTRYILVAMVLGILAGYIVNSSFSGSAEAFAARVELLPFAFLRLIKMIIAPLVFATLVAGIAHMGDTAALGRVGGRAVGWFICASLVSLTLGLILVNLFQPGVGLNFPLPPVDAASGVEKAAVSYTHLTLPTTERV